MSATIYQFPTGGRAGVAAAAHVTTREPIVPAAVAPSLSPAVTACGAAWYHEEAVKEDDRTRKT